MFCLPAIKINVQLNKIGCLSQIGEPLYKILNKILVSLSKCLVWITTIFFHFVHDISDLFKLINFASD